MTCSVVADKVLMDGDCIECCWIVTDGVLTDPVDNDGIESWWIVTDEVLIGLDSDCIEFWGIVTEVLIALSTGEQWLKEVLTDSDCID